jgi:hypothetical protein
MAAQYLELHMLKNENSHLKSKINIYTIHKSKSFNLIISGFKKKKFTLEQAGRPRGGWSSHFAPGKGPVSIV